MRAFWIFITVAAVALAIGWIAYGVWIYMERKKEKLGLKEKPTSERLEQARNEMAEYAKKLAAYKKPPHKRDDQGNQS